ncbi:MAG TPA: protein kinase, partial [Gemmatimonadales bacterium]|nr:protein kinase [Gemmatimonadales bacterium]
MRAEDLARAEELFHRLAQLDSAARATALAEISSEDPALGAEIESLLAAHDTDGVLDRLTAEIAPEPIGPHGSSPLSADVHSGTTMAQYEIGEPIGSGGMGDVYRARDTKLGRDVALKFLPAWLSRDPSARDRFLVEARVVSSIDHTNVCALFDMGETTDGQLYLVMPYYEGETLKRRLTHGPVPVSEAIQIALQTARGLAAAHERGVIHRDIKPSNLLLTDRGRVKLLDFGVAKLADVSLTQTGQTPGTITYMSPEQRTGGEVDFRSDLWSLGAVLHEMLTGRRPADEPEGVATALASGPRAVAEIVSRLLAASPEERYPDALSVAQDLGVLADGGKGLDARPAPSVKRFLAELKRRNVFRVAAVYGVMGFAVIEIAGAVFPNIPLPAWTATLVVWLVLLGFPLALALAWTFETTPGGLRRTRNVRPAILDAIVAQPASRRWPIGLAGALGGALIVAATWFALGDLLSGTGPAGGRPRVTPDATIDVAPGVAVLPFRTVGEDVAELREGMVDLLSFNFDDVPGLRKIDPQSIMTIWSRTVGEGQETDPATMVAVAETLGASYAVIGSAVQVGNQGIVRLGASVYDVRSATLLGFTQLEGRTDSLTALIDRLTIELLRLGLVPTDAGYPVPNLARATTASLPALKAYLAGEREYRQGRWFPAAAHFREAVELDSTFARAFYRLGSAMLSAGAGRRSAQGYLDRAATLAAGLPERDSLLLSVQLSPANVASGASESALRRLTTKYPDDADGWNAMGELRFHAGARDFRPPAEYRNAFERAIALAPHSTEPYMHLLDDAFARRDSSRVRSLLDASGMDQSRFCFRLVYDL